MPLNKRLAITSPFGRRVHPIFGATKMHNGADLKANYENVYSVLDGTVIASGWDSGGGGNYIKVRHSDLFCNLIFTSFRNLLQSGGISKSWIHYRKKVGIPAIRQGPHLHFFSDRKWEIY
ncbi:M23 family metallopeptidase [Chryseobacterium indoltheticum]|uniref:M23 family metallopeptidase n=1 Tax=Chryseobacterium indoltheticum TaxID=254 RepID=UPI003F493610